jgi:hypothetical protein
MATAVIGGLTTSTMLTLLVIPVVYSLLDDLVVRARTRFFPDWAPAVPAHVDEDPDLKELQLEHTEDAEIEQPEVRRVEETEAD